MSQDHDIWHTDGVYGVDDLINIWQISIYIRLNYVPFLTLASCFHVIFRGKLCVGGIVLHKHPL